ncbi:kinase [[Leptolyngbya] sp. PCC 7376]|uniref:AAA family ATPase n=1 Tax=[Leptolyngbya] sp. PCC 7376 TaxID=111781 RepID=UPI00029F0C6E|nr:AAA family ATPase [[Leptolyngbya] sp. PCC 7376]AFY37554.1 kinase [[Leptolyngbya] sp. PCC 7376]
MSRPTLFIFSGLPATGKTTLSRALAKYLGATHLRIDTIEQALRDLCQIQVEGEGYRLAYRVAADNLQLGLSVVSDSCNPIELTRREWEQVAIDNDADVLNIEVICSDKAEHRRRIETRQTDIQTLKLPTWQDVLAREYDLWSGDRLVIDTAGQTITESIATLVRQL